AERDRPPAVARQGAAAGARDGRRAPRQAARRERQDRFRQGAGRGAGAAAAGAGDRVERRYRRPARDRARPARARRRVRRGRRERRPRARGGHPRGDRRPRVGRGRYHGPPMINPRIDELLDQVDSRYALVIVAAKRARQINNYHHQLGEGTFDEFAPPLIESRSKNYLTMSLEEISEGKIVYEYSSTSKK